MSIIEDAKSAYENVPELGNFYDKISLWDKIFSGDPPWSKVKKNGLYASGERKMAGLGAAKVLSDEFSRLTFSEQVTISTAEPYMEYVTNALNDNGFWKRMPEFLSVAYALGGGALKVYAEDGKPRINYVEASLFAPMAWNEQEIFEGIFESKLFRNGHWYTLLERHFFDEKYGTEYKLFCSESRSRLGRECDILEIFPKLEGTENFATNEPMFRYFKPDPSNNIDRFSPLGISIFDGAADTLKALDVAFDSFSREFILGKKRIIVPSECIQTVVDINTGEMRRYFDADDEAFVALKCGDQNDLKITDNTVELRVEEHVDAINALLNILCFQTGLSAGTLSFDTAQGTKTATEVISANSKTARTAKSNKNLVAELIEGLVRSVISLGISLGELPENSDYGIIISMPDGVIIDDNTKIENNTKLVQVGLKSKLSAIMDIQDCDEETAQKELDRINKENQITGELTDLLTIKDDESSENNVVEQAEETANKSLNGAQTSSLISVISQFQAGVLSLGQATNIISAAIGVTKEEARKIIEGAE